MPKTIVVNIKPPKCFSEQSREKRDCKDCIFLFDCIEKKSEKVSPAER